MAKVLSQEEVESLLSGISEGKVQTETDIPEKAEVIKGYGFTRETEPVHLSMPTLGIINERFIGFLKASLSAATRSFMDVNVADMGSVKFGEFTRSITLPVTLNIFKMEPLRGYALLMLEDSLVFAFVDTFFGGRAASNIKLESKGFTSIEAKIIGKVVKLILDDLQHAWSDVYKLKMVFVRAEVDPQFADIALPTEMVITIRFNIDLGGASGQMTICIPYSTLEPIQGKLVLGRQEVQNLLDNLSKSYPKAVEELVPNLLSLGAVQKVLQNLLQERISIRDMLTIVEILADYAPITKDPELLTEYVRHKLSRSIISP